MNLEVISIAPYYLASTLYLVLSYILKYKKS